MRFLFRAGIVLLATMAGGRAEGAFLSYAKFPPARVEQWYYVQAAGNFHWKSLFDYPPGVDVYRFLDCGWDTPCLMVEIVVEKGRAHFKGTQCGGLAGYCIQGVAARTERDLTPAEGRAFQSLLRRSGFATMSSYIDRKILDGYDDILEARVDGIYHFTAREIPDAYPEDRAFYELGAWLCARVPRAAIVEIGVGQGGGATSRSGSALITSPRPPSPGLARGAKPGN